MKSIYESLKNKVVLVTGSAQGIGRTMVKKMAKAELKVVVSDIKESLGEAVAEEIKSEGYKALFVKTDLCNEYSIKKLIEITIEYFGYLDIIVNNARPKLNLLPFEESFSEWDLALDVLLKAPALIAKYAVPHLKKSGGSIINIGSTNAFFVSHQPLAYHVAKSGLLQLTRYLACTFGNQGIRVNTVCPGLVDLYDNNMPLTSNPENKKIVELSVPLQRAALADEIVDAVLFLSSNSAAYITGQTLILDGGITLNDHFHIMKKNVL